MGSSFRNLIVSRFGSRYYWGEDEFGSHGMIQSYFKRPKKKNLKKVNIDTPYLLAASDSKNFMVRKSLVRLVLVCGKMAAKYLYWNLPWIF